MDIAKKKRKRADKDTEMAIATAVAAERTERGGSFRIGDHLNAAQRTTLEALESQSGSPRGTIMLGGQRVSLDDPAEDATMKEDHRQSRRRQSRPKRRQSNHRSNVFDILVVLALR
jgi:hypothetical protein